MRTRPGPITYNPPGAPGSGPSAEVLANITSYAELAAVVTTTLITPAIRIWVNSQDSTEQIWKLLVSTETTDIDSGRLRPNDYDATTNPKVWFRMSS